MANRRWAEMRDLYPARLVELLRERPIVYVPSGILEWHDEQLPMGTDTLKMEEICRRTARLTGGLVHMPSYLGVGAITPSYGGLTHGGIGFSNALAKQYLLELCTQLELLGASMIVLSYGHTGSDNINVHEEAAFEYNQRPQTQARVLAMNDVAPAVRHRYKVADHAAKWETSFMLASCPALVDHARLPADHGDFWGLDPRQHASAAEGERMYSLVAEETAKLVELACLAPRETLADQTYTGSQRCWETCQNLADLASNYWRGDERWEDPFCWYCEWRSSGLMRVLLERQGRSWLERRLALWREAAKPYTIRCKFAMAQIDAEWRELG
jgi:creatinine amidohydrolase